MSTIKNRVDNPEGLHRRYEILKIVRVEAYVDKKWIDVSLFDKDSESLLEGKKQREVKEPVSPESQYFTLRLDTEGDDLRHIIASRIGLNAYADAIKDHIPKLADDIKSQFPVFTEEEIANLEKEFQLKQETSEEDSITDK